MADQSDQERWYILGAGAIGCLWACYWRLTGVPVTLLTRSNQALNTIQLEDGNTVTSCHVDQISTYSLAPSAPFIDNLLVCTKAHQTLAAINSIRHCIHANANVLVIQNGMAGQHLKRVLTTQHIRFGITGDGAYKKQNNTVVHAGKGQTWIGCNATFLKKLPATGLNLSACDNIEHRQWRKLAINCAINGLTAVYHCRNGELLSNREACNRITAICHEITALSIRIGMQDAVADLEENIRQTLTETAENFSSMYQDIEHGKTTEIAYLNGYICELAQQHQVDCEANRRVIEQIRQLELRQW